MDYYNEDILTNLLCIFIFFLFVIVYFILNRNIDDQIRRDIEENGGKLISKEWYASPPRFIRNYTTSYEVRYLDIDGKEHKAICKPGLGGAYWTDDKIINQENS